MLTRAGITAAAGGGAQALALSTLSIPRSTLPGAQVATISGGTAPYVLGGTDVAKFSIGGAQLRLEVPIVDADTGYSITINGLPFAFTIPALVLPTMPSGLFARWDTMDLTKITTTPGKVSQWVDKVAGYIIEQTTDANRPAWDTTDTANGYPAVQFAQASTTGMTASASSTNDPLKAMFNAANAPATILAVATQASTTNTRDLVCWGSPSIIAMLRGTTGSTDINWLRGDSTTGASGISSAALVTHPALDAVGIIGGKIDGTTASTAYDLEHAADFSYGTTLDDAVSVGSAFSVGRRTTGASTTNAFNGRIYALLIWNRALSNSEIDDAMRNLAFDFGHTLPNPAALTYIDLSQYSLTWQDDFDSGSININPDPTTDLTAPTGYIPYYTGTTQKSVYGASGAIADEVGWYVDPREPTRMAAYKDRLFQQSGSILKLRAIPRPPELSDLSLKNGNSVDCTYLCSGMITLGTVDQQYGYAEMRVKFPPAANGVFPAFWQLAQNGRWPVEMDIFEGFGPSDNSNLHSTVHVDAYWPDFSGSGQQNGPFLYPAPSVADKSAGYHLIGCDESPAGISMYFDRALVGTMPPINGVKSVAINNGGSGVLADNGTPNGTMSIRALSSLSGASSATCVATVTAGVITSLSALTKPGTAIPANPTWQRITLLSGSTVIGGGATFTTVLNSDPAMPTALNTPFYLLMAMQMGAFTGTPDGTSEFELAIDYVRLYKKNLSAPTIAGGTDADAQAIFDRATALSAPFSGAQQTKINNFVKAMKAWQLRFDTVPMGLHTSDWDVTKLSLWDAMQVYAEFGFGASSAQALINWRNPGTDCTLIGSPAFTAGAGFAVDGSVGISCPTISGSSLVQQYDSHLGLDYSNLTLTGSLVDLINSGANFRLLSSNTAHDLRLLSSTGQTGFQTALPLPASGYLVAARGWRYQSMLFRDGAAWRGGYNGNITTTGIGAVVIGQGAPLTAKAVSYGRRLMPDEVAKLAELRAALA